MWEGRRNPGPKKKFKNFRVQLKNPKSMKGYIRFTKKIKNLLFKNKFKLLMISFIKFEFFVQFNITNSPLWSFYKGKILKPTFSFSWKIFLLSLSKSTFTLCKLFFIPFPLRISIYFIFQLWYECTQNEVCFWKRLFADWEIPDRLKRN